MKELQYPFDPALLMDSKKKLRRELLKDGTPRTPIKVAVLGGSTTSDIIKMLELFLLDRGVKPEFYESEYNFWWQDAVFGSEELDSFKPDIVFVHTTVRNLERFFPSLDDDAEKREDECFEYFFKAWESLERRYGCTVIQNNFELPIFRLLGNRDCWDSRGAVRFVSRMNERFAAYASGRERFYINDVNYVAACYGLDRWHDEKAWCMYKYAMCTDAVPEFAYNLARIICSLCGRNKKALALDLDNTLWGGVVGDDGPEGIEIGSETATGECFLGFQRYLKKLQGIGVMLTVASKNDRENAVAGLERADCVLHPDDFIVIKANWETKDRNIAQTAAQMDLGTDAFVFVDDNPTERALVRSSLPGTAVPELESPDEYVRVLDRSGWFEVTAFSADDLRRNDMYRANAMRAEVQSSFTDYTEYLLSLDMHADILPFDPVSIPRITQLTNKSNQFNLTTRRYTQPEIENAAADGDRITLYGRLTDTFGDNGIVSVVIGHIEGESCDIELWLMSCRVLKKDMELAMLDTLVGKCRARGVKQLKGTYLPTAKNGMVRGLYESFGFEKTYETPEGETGWVLELEGYADKNKVIAVNGGKRENGNDE